MREMQSAMLERLRNPSSNSVAVRAFGDVRGEEPQQVEVTVGLQGLCLGIDGFELNLFALDLRMDLCRAFERGVGNGDRLVVALPEREGQIGERLRLPFVEVSEIAVAGDQRRGFEIVAQDRKFEFGIGQSVVCRSQQLAGGRHGGDGRGVGELVLVGYIQVACRGGERRHHARKAVS